MPVNKVEYFGNTLLDLTGDNVTPGDVKKGVVFHDATGAQQIGEGASLDVNEQTNPSGGKTVYINSEAPEESVLPEGYTRLKYIQSDGRQYVNTGVYPDQDTKISLKVSCENGDFYCRVGQSTGSQRFGLYAVRDTSRIDFLFGGVGYVTGAISGLSFPAEISLENGLLTANQKTYEFAPQGAFTAPRTLPLFAEDVNGSIAKGKGRLYEGQIYGSGTIVRNYIPCLNANGEAGLWDAVNNVFYGDAAGVGFIAGPVVLEYTLPEGFEELAWIKSSGGQYINTNFVPDNNTRVVMDIKLADGSAAAALFGVRYSASSRNYTLVFTSNTSAFRSDYNSEYSQEWAVERTTRRTVDKDKETTTIDGVSKSYTNAEFQAPGPLYLLAANDNGSVRWPAAAELYQTQIYDNGTLVRYYVPCRTNTGEVGLWDVVYEVFYGDVTGVGFIAGPVVGKGVSKVVLEDEVLIDLTGDTISPETVLAGFIGHDKTGAQFVGELLQKAGGRPMATGSFSSSAASYSITGLEFAPKIVFVVKTAFSAPAAGTQPYFVLYYNSESGDRYQYHYSLDMFGYGTTLGNTTTNVLTLSGNGFSVTSGSASLKFNGDYRWVAIGAAA